MKTARVVSTVVAALALSAGAHASPITYDYTSGAIDITGLTVDGTSVLPTGSEPAIVLAATSTATLDTTADTLSFAVSQAASQSITLCCSFTNGSNTFSFASANAILSSLTADSIGSLTLTSSGGGNYTFNTGSSSGVTLSGSGEITGATENGISLGTLGPKTWSVGTPISGSVAVTADQQMLQMDGVPLGTFTVDNQTVTVMGNIIFQGNMVPIPGTAWLLASALGLLGVLLSRTRLSAWRPPPRAAWIAASAAALCLGLSAAPRTASADTILTYDLTSGSVLAGNATTPPSAFCLTGNLCPGTPAYGLGTSEPLSGTVSFDLTKDTLSFDLTLTAPATFGTGGPTVGSGSTLVATNQAITVGSSTTGGVTTYSFSPGTSGDSMVANLLLSSGFSETQSSASMPGIECSASSGSTSGSCSLTMGVSTGSGSNALLINGGGTTYNGVLSVGANMTQVPLPASLWLLLGAVGGLLIFRVLRSDQLPLRSVRS